MSSFDPSKRHLRELLIYFFNLKKSAAEAHRLLVETYGKAALSDRTCREWFQKLLDYYYYWIKIRAKHKKDNTMDNTSNKT